MIAEVQKALTAYTKLDTVGKRLFRDEIGLVRPQQATKRRRRAKTKDDSQGSGGQGEAVVVRRTRRPSIDPAHAPETAPAV